MLDGFGQWVPAVGWPQAVGATIAGAVLLIAAGAAGGQAPPDLMKIPVFYSVPGTERVRVERDIVFRSAGDTRLKADIYLPAARGAFPVVLLVSGGSVDDWRTAAFYTSFARVLAAEGIAAVNYDKRLARDRNSLAMASEDSLALVDHLHSNAAKYGLDTSRLCTWHFSAGGTVAGTMLGEKSPASCVVLTYAILSLGESDADPQLSPYSALVRARERGDRFPPTLVVRAGRDAKTLNDAIDAFVAAALAKNAPVSLINYPAGDHGFEILNDTDETRRVIAESIGWVKSRLTR
jgi:acetyl esterase/lipase